MFSNHSLLPRPFVVLAAVLAILLPLAVGCGSRKAKVTGSVTLDGKALPKGTIVFHPSKGAAVSAEITDGQYTVAGVPPGDAKITVDTAYLKQEAVALNMAKQNMSMSMGRTAPGSNMPPEAKAALENEKQSAQENAQKAKDLEAQYRHIPEKYTKEESSGLSLQVKSGSNNFDVPLSSR